jgi:hypothetical protein
MAWAAIDDAILDNGKIGRAGALGLLLHTAAIVWCARNLTDGRIPKAKVPCLLNLSGVLVAPGNDAGVPRRGVGDAERVRPDADAIAEHLAAVGLWHDRGDEWELHDYLEYNPSRAHVLYLRACRAAAGRTGGLRSAAGRARGGPESAAESPTSKQVLKQNSSKTQPPSPSPSPEEEDPDARARATQVEGRTRARDRTEPDGRPAHHMRRGPARAVPTTPRGGDPVRLGDVLAAAVRRTQVPP